MKSVVIGFLIVVLGVCAATSQAQSLADEVDRLYDFIPRNITDEQKQAKGEMLDAFWVKIKSDTARYLPLLRSELQTLTHLPYFYYDGASLLLSLSAGRADTLLAINSMAKADVEDLSQRVYVKTLNLLARKGYDVTRPALKILNVDDYSFFIEQHSMNFNQGYCLTYMLVPQPTTAYVDTLRAIFPTLSTGAQRSVITTLWFAHTCKGNTLLTEIVSDKTLDGDVSNYAKKILGYTKISADALQFYDLSTAAKIEALRMQALSYFNDEAIHDLDLTTRLLRRDQQCR